MTRRAARTLPAGGWHSQDVMSTLERHREDDRGRCAAGCEEDRWPCQVAVRHAAILTELPPDGRPHAGVRVAPGTLLRLSRYEPWLGRELLFRATRVLTELERHTGPCVWLDGARLDGERWVRTQVLVHRSVLADAAAGAGSVS